MYAPPQKILERYADVLVNFALGGGKGIKKGEVVHLVCYEAGKALFLLLKRAILKSGGHIIPDYRPDSGSRFPFDRTFFELAKPHQLRFFPRTYARGLVSQMDHTIFVISEVDLHELEGIPPKKIMRRGLAWKPYMDWRQENKPEGNTHGPLHSSEQGPWHGRPNSPKRRTGMRLSERVFWTRKTRYGSGKKCMGSLSKRAKN